MKHIVEPDVTSLGAVVPAEPGFYWARWRTPWGPVQDVTHADRWEVVDVFVNDGDTETLSLMVLVAGVEKPQKLEDFIWGQGPLPEPA